MIKLFLDELRLCDINVAFCRSINDRLAHVATLSKLYLWWSQVWLHIEVNQTPVLEERMQPDYTTDVSWQLLATLRGRKIRIRILPIEFDDEVSEIHVGLWILVAEFVAEEFWESLHFNFMNC